MTKNASNNSSNTASRKYFFIFVPFIIISTLFFVLYSGLTFIPNSTSVKMLNKPLPHVRDTNLYQWSDLIDTTDFQKQNPGRWYLINFWASWCESCQNEHPFLMDLARQGITIYGFNYNDGAPAARKWLADYGNPYKSVSWDARSLAGGSLGVSSIPTTFLVDPDGVLRCKITGPLTATVWNKTLIPLIEKNEKAD